MKLSEALDRLFEDDDFNYRNWRNPIRPYFISGITQTPYEAYQQLSEPYKRIINNWIGREPQKGEE